MNWRQTKSQQSAAADQRGLDANLLLEAALVEALAQDQDILPHALTLIRRRTGHDDVRFTSTADAAAALPPAGGVPVGTGDTTYGWLESATLDGATLKDHAAWLLKWLMLGERQATLGRQAMTDQLTGAYNRRFFDQFLAAAVSAAEAAARTEASPNHSVSVLLFDIDDFKRYNDQYGHPAGDEILRETVRLLSSVIRPTDRVCRIGGDEFAVVFHDAAGPRKPDSRPPDLGGITRRFQRQICEHRFPKLSQLAPGTLTISGGMASYPWDGGTPEELCTRADELCIQSKRAGKNVITLGPGAERMCTNGRPE